MMKARIVIALVLAGAFLLTARTGPALATSARPAATTPALAAGWHWENPLPHGNALSSVSCPDSRACYAVGSGTIMVSHDGGATWAVTFDRAKGSLSALSCPSGTTCFAISNTGGNASSIVRTTDSGVTWTAVHQGQAGWDQLSCPTTGVCYVAGTYMKNMLVTRDGGATWRTQHPPIQPVSLTCPGATICYAPLATNLVTSPPPSVAVTSNGGASWTARAVGIARGAAQLSTTRCPTTTTCIVIGYGPLERPFALKTSNGGASWQRRDFSLDIAFRGAALSCPSRSVCYLGGDNGTTSGVFATTTDGGTTWKRGTALPFVPSGISCSSVTTCVAVGRAGAVLRTTNGWKTRTFETVNAVTSAVPHAFPPLRAVTCLSSTVCYAAGDWGSMAKTVDGGTHWKGVGAPLSRALRGGNIGSVACTGPTICFAGSFAPWGVNLVSTRDGGKTWSTKPGAGVGSVDCPSKLVCYAGGPRGAIRVTRDGGTTWHSQTTPLKGKAYTIEHLLCPSTTVCYATALGPPHRINNVGALLQTRNGGATWRSIPTDRAPYALACGTPTDCIALIGPSPVDRAVPTLRTHDGGQTWTNSAALPPGAWFAITCPDGSTCVLAGSAGATATSHDGGATWLREQTPTFNDLYAVTCAGSNTCRAVGDFSAILARP